MSLVSFLREDRMKARLHGPKTTADLLTVLLGEVEMVGINDGKRETSDVEGIAIIKKFVKNAEENAQHWNHRNPASQAKRQPFLQEIAVLSQYLPAQMSSEELTKVLVEQFGCVITAADRGAMMGYLKQNFAGQYDGKLASDVVSKLINRD